MSNSAFIANAAAGLVVSKFGTTPVNISELKETLNKDSLSYKSGIFNISELKKQFAYSRQQNETIVMTNGCFDILHPGHVDYLKKARLLGDRLVIAVNDDQSVQRLKGPNRPINSINDRMLLLSALECVDWVIPFSEDSPLNIYSELTPDILVKGSDYQIDDVVGKDLVTDAGGRVVLIDYIDGYSTTQQIQK